MEGAGGPRRGKAAGGRPKADQRPKARGQRPEADQRPYMRRNMPKIKMSKPTLHVDT
jgi:hypothetical protein